MNKPKGYIMTVTDDRDRKTVSDLVSDVQARLFPVGRLDRDTTGLLIMTDDGDLAYKITHPGYEITKTYRALITGTISKEKIWALRNGVDIGGFVTVTANLYFYPSALLAHQNYVKHLSGRVVQVVVGPTADSLASEIAAL